MGIGFVAGLISTIGYVYLSPLLERKFGLQDTCGVHNLHGMPGILGGIGGTFSALLATKEEYPDLVEIFPNRAEPSFSAADQAGVQILALVITLVIAIFGGLFTGFLLKKVTRNVDDRGLYKDDIEWEVP